MNKGTEKQQNNKYVTITKEEYESLQKRYNDLKEEYDHLEKTLKWMEEQLKTAKNEKYGSKSAKASEEIVGQMSLLFDEPEFYKYLESIKEETRGVSSYSRVIKKEKTYMMDTFPEDLPKEITVYDISDEEKKCPVCGSELTQIGKEVKREIEIIPEQYIVHEHQYLKYACKACEKETGETAIVEAEREPEMYPGSNASPKAVAFLMTEKYVMGTPLYRMEQDNKRRGIGLSRQTMSNWMIHCSENWLEPLYDELHRKLLEAEIINADETTVQVLHEQDKKAQSKSYMWLYRTGSYAEHPIVLFDYQPSRAQDKPVEFLNGFRGKYLQTDGYQVYKGIENVIHVGCLAHLKRKFHDAVAVLPKDQKKGAATDGEAYCNAIFKIEESIADLTPEERYKVRQEKVKPLFDEFLAWGNTRTASSKSKLGVALTYLHNQGEDIQNYLLDGRLDASNNIAERSIKMFVIDRKNFLFANTPLGAKCSAVTFSIIQTALENGLDPYKYLTYIFEAAPRLDQSKNDWIAPLLPENAPEQCKSMK